MLTERRSHIPRPQPIPFLRGLAAALAAAFVALAIAAIAPAAEAAPGWSAPVELSVGTTNAYDAQVAVDPRGDATATWMQSATGGFTVQVATRPAGGAWSAPMTVSSPNVPASEPSVAMDAEGDAIVAWKQYVGTDEIEAVTRAAGAASWGAAETLSNPLRESTAAQAAISPSGQAIVLFTGEDAVGNTRIQATAEQGFGGLWGAPIMLSAAGQDAEEPSLAIDGAGEAIAAWRRPNGNAQIIQSSARSTTGAWGAPINLSSLFADGFHPRVATNAAGDAAVVWTAALNADEVAAIATRTALGAWTGAKTVSGQVDPAREPRAAIDGAGNVTVVWNLVSNGEFTVQEITAPAGTEAWAGATTLSPAMSEESELSLALDPAGDAMATFAIEEGGTEVMRAVTRTAAPGSWSSPLTFSAPGVRSTQAQVALDATGEATAVWRAESPGGNDVIEAATFDPAAELPVDAGGGGASGDGTSGSADGGASAAPKPATARCPKGKVLRKVRVRLPTKRAGANRKAKPRFKTELKCVARAPHKKKQPTRHRTRGIESDQ